VIFAAYKFGCECFHIPGLYSSEILLTINVLPNVFLEEQQQSLAFEKVFLEQFSIQRRVQEFAVTGNVLSRFVVQIAEGHQRFRELPLLNLLVQKGNDVMMARVAIYF